MRKTTLLLIYLLLMAPVTSAQRLAIIKDPNGFCNVRDGYSIHSKITDTLTNGRLVFAFEEDPQDLWLDCDYHRSNALLSGAIHRSRLDFLDAYPTSTPAKRDQHFAVAVIGPCIVRMEDAPVTKSEQALVKAKGSFVYGTDGGVPHKKISRLLVSVAGKTVAVPVASYKDLYEPDLKSIRIYKVALSDAYYIETLNSDGAGAYIAVWKIAGGKYAGRQIFIPF